MVPSYSVRVTRTEHDGTITVIADRYDGKLLNSPNDVVCRSDGSIWFTDPPFGVLSYSEGHVASPELPTSVYRVDPGSGRLAVLTGDVNRPNGLAFSPDERRLYVFDTGRTHVENGPAHIRVFDVNDGKLTGGDVFADCPVGLFDGFRLDEAGNVWTSAGEGVLCYDPGGNLIGSISVPDPVANVCFGGPARNRLFICATGAVYAIYLQTNGLKLV